MSGVSFGGVFFVFLVSALIIVVATAWFFYVQMRNRAVYYFRLLVLQMDIVESKRLGVVGPYTPLYDLLPSYDEMSRKWWIMDLTRFCPEMRKRNVL